MNAEKFSSQKRGREKSFYRRERILFILPLKRSDKEEIV